MASSSISSSGRRVPKTETPRTFKLRKSMHPFFNAPYAYTFHWIDQLNTLPSIRGTLRQLLLGLHLALVIELALLITGTRLPDYLFKANKDQPWGVLVALLLLGALFFIEHYCHSAISSARFNAHFSEGSTPSRRNGALLVWLLYSLSLAAFLALAVVIQLTTQSTGK